MDDLLVAARGLAAVLAQGQTYEDAARRIMDYDAVPYPVPYVFMSSTVAAFLRALAQAEGRGVTSTAPTYPVPSYGPALREPTR